MLTKVQKHQVSVESSRATLIFSQNVISALAEGWQSIFIIKTEIERVENIFRYHALAHTEGNIIKQKFQEDKLYRKYEKGNNSRGSWLRGSGIFIGV